MSDDPKNKPVWPGAYRLEGDRTKVLDLFFAAIRRRAPEVLESLREKVLPVFMARGGSPEPFELALSRWTSQFNLAPRYDRSRVANLQDQELAELFICEQSLSGFVTAILRHWSESPPEREALTLQQRIEYSAEDELAVFNTMFALWIRTGEISSSSAPPAPNYAFGCSPWNPRRETRAQARHRILAELTTKVDQALEGEEKRAQLGGLERAPLKQQGDHFEWLVRYQIQGWSHNKIAREYKTFRQTVAEGINSASELLIGSAWKFWLRAQKKGGRPRK